MGDDYVQLVGAECAVCQKRVATAREARACATCRAVVHRKCAGHTCAPEAVVTAQQAAAPPKKERWGGWPFVGATLGVMLASGLAPLWNHWREHSFIREHAAANLRCSPDDVRVEIHNDEIRADGCHDYVTYLVGCRPVTKDECLVVDHIPEGRINDMIEDSLHLR